MVEVVAERIRFLNPAKLAAPPGYSNIAEVRSGRVVYIAGQVAIDASGSLVGVGDFAAQAEKAFSNLGHALESIGCNARDLAKLTVYVRDMDRIAEYRSARDHFFASTTPIACPAITLVEVSRLFHDQLLIEIEAVAIAA